MENILSLGISLMCICVSALVSLSVSENATSVHTCGNTTLTATDKPQYLQTPGYPNGYRDNDSCVWTIKAELDYMKVQLIVEDDGVEYGLTCNHDFGKAFDGPSVKSPLLATWCNEKTPEVKSSGHVMTVQFYADWYATFRGFKAKFFQTNEIDSCGGNVDVMSFLTRIQTLVSPGYPHGYRSDMECVWILQAMGGSRIRIQVLNTSLEATSTSSTKCHDFVAVHDGQTECSSELGRFCGSDTPTLISSGPYVRIGFYSDKSIEHQGFRLQFDSGLFDYAGTCSWEINATEAIQYLFMPNFDQSNESCWWRLQAAEGHNVVMEVMNPYNVTGCPTTTLAIYDGQDSSDPLLAEICPNEKMSIVSSGRTLYIYMEQGYTFTVTKIHIQVYAVPQCGGQLTSVGTLTHLTSPGYPQNYFSDLACFWTIWTPSDTSDIVLEVVDSDLEGSPPSCSKDAVKVWRYAIDKVGTFCSTSTPNFTIPNVLKVMFTTNNAVVKKGFRMKLNAVKQNITPSCGPQNLNAVQSDRYLVSPEYPMAYDRYLHVDCQWTLTSSDPDMMVHIEVLDSHMDGYRDCDYGDKVYVYDGPDKTAAIIQIWCENMKPEVQSSGSSLTVRFVTSDQRLRRGFKLRYTETREPFPCGGQVNVNSSKQYLVSPGYPANYRRNMKCVWILRSPQNTSIHISVWKSSIGDGNTCNGSYVSVRDGANEDSKEIGVFCGKKQPTYISSGNVMSVILHTGPGSVKQGFVIDYISGLFHDPYDCGGHIQLNATVTFCNLQPPGSFSNYYFDMKCVWVIEANNQNLKISIDSVDLTFSPSCTEEYITVHDGSLSKPSLIGKFCGHLGFSEDHVTSGKEMVVTFQSRKPNNVQSGFSASVFAGDFEICTLQEQMAWDTITYITSPNYPFNYPRNAHCSWRLDTDGAAHIAVQLTVISFNTTKVSTSCDSNYLEAFDGYDPSSPSLARWCGAGHAHNVISSTGRYLFLKFDTSYDTPNTGFNVSIKRIYSPQDSPKGVIIGIAVGVIAGVFVIVAIGYHVVRRGSCFQSDTIAHRTNLHRFFYKNTHQ
ncbi:cubilin-like [Haliotis rubra]|uniref:cubilin-like n=1 Tax=Haliotis rubra TaxID=36100 RepID=UPI001EE50982|nr:cubilin-like [Haliotis rubra]